jgi:hypothetical protein
VRLPARADPGLADVFIETHFLNPELGASVYSIGSKRRERKKKLHSGRFLSGFLDSRDWA